MDYQFLWQCLLVAIRYIPITLYLSLSAYAIGLVVGVPMALARYFKIPVLARFFEWWINLTNAIQILLILTVFYLFLASCLTPLGQECQFQIFKSSIPVLGNIITNLIKGSSLVSAVSVVDLLNAVLIKSQTNYKYLEAYIAAAIVYWPVCTAITQGVNLLSIWKLKGGLAS